ncbi:MAG: adenylyl-sulfate kinase [Desulfobacterales bacterium]|nr:MAG: adenylyl-sulfate kinase [Desulfobacterales bacterium]
MYHNDYSESLIVHFRRVETLRREALELKEIGLNGRQQADLELLLNRGMYPLTGYMGREEYTHVLDTMRLPDGTVFPIPICLDVPAEMAQRLEVGEKVALNDREGVLLAILTIKDLWKVDKRLEAERVYGTSDEAKHPGVAVLYDTVNDWYVAGALEGICLPVHYDFQQLRLTPSETVRRFSMNGWRKVLGFHTDEYLHCAHREMVLGAAREEGAAIFLHPVADMLHPGDIDYYTQVRCYQHFVEKFPPNMIMLGLTPFASRKAGPRAAVWQAIIRKNFGCSHFMVAEDHADPFKNGNLVAEFENETGITMVPEKKMGYQPEKKMYVALNEADGDLLENISSAELQRKLDTDEHIPEWFSYPEIVDELKKTFPPRSKQGFTIFLTGLSGSGKSTIARVLLTKFLETRDRPVTLLDGDIVRKNLSSELTFSKEHRNLNITRIGFVASEITKNGGIAICAPIAPYEASRQANRELISRCGGYIEIYVATPLEVCEARDRKGLYAKARAGIVKDVTGISDPYVEPSNPELVIDTTDITPMEAVQEILLYLQQQGYLV